MNKLETGRMNPTMKRQAPFWLFKLSLTYTLAGSTLFLLTVDIAHLFSGELIPSDLTLLPVGLVFLCLILFVPVFVGVVLLQLFLRYQSRKGRLTPKTGILSGITIWGLAGIALCLFLTVLDRLPVDQHPRPHDFLILIPALLNEPSLLLGIATACLVGGWAGHVLSNQILFDQQTPLSEA